MKLNCPTDPFAPEALSVDAFLGGAVQIAQPLKGYRAGVDPVLLAASVPARAEQSVLELGCGGGVASLCLGRRISGLALTGVEVQTAYADLARKNAQRNEIDFTVYQADLDELPFEVRSQRFDHVIANPPYFDRKRSTPAQDEGRERGLGEVTPLSSWVAIASKRLAPKGQAHFVQRIERLPDLLSALHTHLGSIEVQPLSSRQGRAPHLILVRAKKGGRADFCLYAPIVMHKGAAHQENTKDYNAVIEAVLRHGAGLTFGPTA
jgi:tRNA1(Val) A37 N6-methylase TrmN6